MPASAWVNRFKAKSDGESPRRGGVTPFIQVVLRKRAIQSLLLFVPVYLRSLATLTKFANDAGITAASLTAIGAFESATWLIRLRKESIPGNRGRPAVRSPECHWRRCRQRRGESKPSPSCRARSVRWHDPWRPPSQRQGATDPGSRFDLYAGEAKTEEAGRHRNCPYRPGRRQALNSPALSQRCWGMTA